MNIRKGLALAIGLLAVLTPGLASAAGHGWTVRFNFVPQRAYQGQPAAVSVLVKPSNARCLLVVRYADGSLQGGLDTTRASAGRVAWKWNVAENAPVGAAKAVVQCGRSANLTRAFTVVGGTVRHSRLSVVTSGYSQRPDRYDLGSSVSYGVVLNTSSSIASVM